MNLHCFPSCSFRPGKLTYRDNLTRTPVLSGPTGLSQWRALMGSGEGKKDGNEAFPSPGPFLKGHLELALTLNPRKFSQRGYLGQDLLRASVTASFPCPFKRRARSLPLRDGMLDCCANFYSFPSHTLLENSSRIAMFWLCHLLLFWVHGWWNNLLNCCHC